MRIRVLDKPLRRILTTPVFEGCPMDCNYNVKVEIPINSSFKLYMQYPIDNTVWIEIFPYNQASQNDLFFFEVTNDGLSIYCRGEESPGDVMLVY